MHTIIFKGWSVDFLLAILILLEPSIIFDDFDDPSHDQPFHLFLVICVIKFSSIFDPSPLKDGDVIYGLPLA